MRMLCNLKQFILILNISICRQCNIHIILKGWHCFFINTCTLNIPMRCLVVFVCFKDYLSLCVYACFACMHFYGPHVYASVHCLSACYLRRPKEGIKSSGTGVTDKCKIPSECWGSNLGPPEERQVLLQLNHCSSPPIRNFLFCVCVNMFAYSKFGEVRTFRSQFSLSMWVLRTNSGYWVCC